MNAGIFSARLPIIEQWIKKFNDPYDEQIRELVVKNDLLTKGSTIQPSYEFLQDLIGCTFVEIIKNVDSAKIASSFVKSTWIRQKNAVGFEQIPTEFITYDRTFIEQVSKITRLEGYPIFVPFERSLKLDDEKYEGVLIGVINFPNKNFGISATCINQIGKSKAYLSIVIADKDNPTILGYAPLLLEIVYPIMCFLADDNPLAHSWRTTASDSRSKKINNRNSLKPDSYICKDFFTASDIKTALSNKNVPILNNVSIESTNDDTHRINKEFIDSLLTQLNNICSRLVFFDKNPYQLSFWAELITATNTVRIVKNHLTHMDVDELCLPKTFLEELYSLLCTWLNIGLKESTKRKEKNQLKNLLNRFIQELGFKHWDEVDESDAIRDSLFLGQAIIISVKTQARILERDKKLPVTLTPNMDAKYVKGGLDSYRAFLLKREHQTGDGSALIKYNEVTQAIIKFFAEQHVRGNINWETCMTLLKAYQECENEHLTHYFLKKNERNEAFEMGYEILIRSMVNSLPN